MKNFKQSVSELYAAVVITLLSISFWSVLVLFFRPLYFWSISIFHIEANSGFSRSLIMENYNALIDYFYPFTSGNLSLPSLIQSEHGIQHFAEVKSIFNLLILLIPITCILLLNYILLTKKAHNPHYLKTASITLILAPFILGSGFIIDFDKTFTLFHKLFFQNNYWLFNSKTDPIIKMLPEEFFMLCGIVIIVMQFLMSFICYFIYRKLRTIDNHPL